MQFSFFAPPKPSTEASPTTTISPTKLASIHHEPLQEPPPSLQIRSMCSYPPPSPPSSPPSLTSSTPPPSTNPPSSGGSPPVTDLPSTTPCAQICPPPLHVRRSALRHCCVLVAIVFSSPRPRRRHVLVTASSPHPPSSHIT
ncbi:leucine-rich repeat extensin-like protein 2 [Vigna umbellata]|uniref:leucine-rich repeat extensin-like protein 2 n=1 Tax=Vigna umbellata TaxID=87088 RepID=UPI001F5FAB77|nr:leucine-rich repeat extensin-like protein 2 [Vigna umbellata]